MNKNKKSLTLTILSLLMLFIAGCSQGQIIDGGGIEIPEEIEKEIIPETEDLSSCKSYFDGCNNCFVVEGQIAGCTRKFCSEEIMEPAKCMLYNDQTNVGNIILIDEQNIDIVTGDIAQRYEIAGVDISQFKVGDRVEIIYNRDSENKYLLANIIEYVEQTDIVACPEIYQPVCVLVEDVETTFPNECTARDNEIVYQGECREPVEEPLICTREYVPVCALVDGVETTFPNECTAGDNGIVYQGECNVEEPRICTLEYAPVCGLENGEEKTFGNKCQAGDNPIIHEGECVQE